VKFGRVPVAEAAGAVLAHTLRLPGGVLKKGRRLGAAELALLAAGGVDSVVAARLEAGDVHEDEAAARIAVAVAGAGVRVADAFTGRANLHALSRGVVVVDRAAVDRLNQIDESLTLATVAPFALVEAGEMVATVKVIPFAARLEPVAAAAAVGAAVRVAPLVPHVAGVVLTRLPGMSEALLDQPAKNLRVRLEALGSSVGRELRCAHDEAAVTAALAELVAAGLGPILLLGASAITDRADVIPAAVARAGGAIVHLGMPVDPGNLLLLARHGGTPVVGVPGCARSLKPSGFDWVLERLCADLDVTRADVMAMGVGGLLKEIPGRPQPRTPAAARPAPPRIGAVVLAAGQSRRMGTNKLLLPVAGVPMVAHVVDALLAAPVRPVVVVLGHEGAAVRAALAGRDVRFVENPEHAAGMSTSLRAGIAELAAGVDGALVCLGDMPWVRARDVQALIDAFAPASGRTICVPAHQGKRGNPVLWAARHFAEMQRLAGDVGARTLIEAHADEVATVEVDDPGVTIDVDTREALAELEEKPPCR
jgi:molybdenum cofactor cytidylyltransferase